jgi:mono/diheme cytochrome c family protein
MEKSTDFLYQEVNMARRIFLCSLIVVLVSTLSLAQTVKKTPAPYTNPASGSEMFKAYCASCHGVDGKGNGPAASAMKAPLPDLTQLSKKNGGTYPANHVAAIISGDANSPAHGSAEMPVWGPVFMRVSQSHQGQVQQRIHNLTTHIESLQSK